MSGQSETRVYIGRVPREGNHYTSAKSNNLAEKRDFERFFQGFGDLVEVKLMAGFAFVEFKEARDARDAIGGSSSPCSFWLIFAELSIRPFLLLLTLSFRWQEIPRRKVSALDYCLTKACSSNLLEEAPVVVKSNFLIMRC
jgi:RNA recognition motif-containing protein